jgi:hypothetical protein
VKRRATVAILAAVVPSAAVSGCATTFDSSNTTAPAVTTTTVFVATGSTADLLDQLLAELSGLSEAIVDNSHQRDIVTRADAIWDAARDGVAARHGALVDEFDAEMGLAHLGVDRRRPADADRAYANLRALVASTYPTSPS